MTAFSTISHLYILLAILCLLWTLDVDASYKIKLISIKKCKLLESRMDRGAGAEVEYHVSARKVDRDTTLVRTNFTVGKRIGPIAVSFRCYQLQQSSARDLVFQVERVPCSSAFFLQLMRVLNVTLTADCYALPGTYTADRINIDDFKWLLTRAMVGAGKYSFDLEFVSGRGVVACVDTACDIVTIK